MYIKDVIQANLLVVKQDVASEIFNIDAGLPITLTNLAKLILKLTHKKHLKIKYTVPRPEIYYIVTLILVKQIDC